jgi:hypothetical protein
MIAIIRVGIAEGGPWFTTLADIKSVFSLLDRNRSGNHADLAASPDLLHRDGVRFSSAALCGTEAILADVIAQRNDLGVLKKGMI